MPSSISSSDARSNLGSGLRLTASDRPGVAQPVPERDVPVQPWRGIFFVALLLFVMLMAAWEFYWRDYGVEPRYRNSDGLWAMQRRRIDDGEGGKTVIVSDSRLLFDVDLDTWQRLSGERPIQLALEGTSALFTLEDLADDPKFTGRLLVGVSPQQFFTGFGFRRGAVKYFHKQSPSQRIGQWLSMHLLEPLFAFYDSDFALATVVKRQDWPRRDGLPRFEDVRKLAVFDADRNTRMWSKVERDPEYQALAQHIWAQRFGPLDADKQAKLDQTIQKELDRAVSVIAKLHARGIKVTFVRPPSGGQYLDYEHRDFSRAKTWDVLLAKTGARGIHFEDYPELQGYRLPEWSHLAESERPRFTEALYRVVEQERATKP